MRFQPSAHSPTTYGDAVASILVEAKRLPVLRQGATDAQTGNAVSRAINALIRNGIPVAGLTKPITPGRAAYGAKVAASVKAFQKDYDLSPADGLVGPKTWEVLLTLEATSGVKVAAGGNDVEIPANTTPLLPAGSAPAGMLPAPPEEIKLPDGTIVSRLPQSPWKQFRESKWFWPAVSGVALTGVVVVGMVLFAARKSVSKKSS